jgi:hypothetical protein
MLIKMLAMQIWPFCAATAGGSGDRWSAFWGAPGWRAQPERI